MSDIQISALAPHHERSSFSCGVEALDRYIVQQASQDQRRNVARLFVATSRQSQAVIGYYSLSSASVQLRSLPEALARRLPRYPEVPCVLIGRLAIDRAHQGSGLGAKLLRDALQRILAWQTEIGVWAVLVDAIDERAAEFYMRFGFHRFEDEADRLFIPLASVRQALSPGESGEQRAP